MWPRRHPACSTADRRRAAASRTMPCGAACKQPRLNVAALIVAGVDDESLTIGYGIKLSCPLVDVVRTHDAQVHIADVIARSCFNLEVPGILPLCVAQVDFVARLEGPYQNFASLASPRLDAQQHLLAGFPTKHLPLVGDTQRVRAVDRGDDLSFVNDGFRTRQRRRRHSGGRDRVRRCVLRQSRLPFRRVEVALRAFQGRCHRKASVHRHL